MGQELVDLGHAQVLGMADVVKVDELTYPMDIGIGGTGRVMLQVDLVV